MTALCCNNDALKGHYYLQKAVTTDQITQQNSLQGAGAPDFQANTKPRIFFKANVGHHKIQEDSCEEIQL